MTPRKTQTTTHLRLQFVVSGVVSGWWPINSLLSSIETDLDKLTDMSMCSPACDQSASTASTLRSRQTSTYSPIYYALRLRSIGTDCILSVTETDLDGLTDMCSPAAINQRRLHPLLRLRQTSTGSPMLLLLLTHDPVGMSRGV